MKTLLLVLFAWAACIASLAVAMRGAEPATCSGATIPVCGPGAPSGDVQTKPAAVPTSAGTVTTYDAYIKSVVIVNTTAGALTFTLADRQSSAKDVLSAVSVAANTTYVVAFPVPYWAPSGFTVVASGAGLNYWVAWRQ
jgi:hypothetical protein